MISIKPAIYNINAFDADIQTSFSYQWLGFQQFGNVCTIRNNDTNTIVYQNTQSTMQLKHDLIIPNSLSNGILYNMTIRVFDRNNVMSDESDPVLFYCFSQPNFNITNITENQIIQNSSYIVNLSYNQPEGEELQYYQLLLYNTNKNQIWSSGVKYDTSSLSATLIDLDDNGVYFVRATGKTINGMDVDTGYIRFSVNYIMPSIYALVTLENIASEGSIKIQSNILSLEGKYFGSGDPTYLDNDYINLTNKNNNVYFDEGFTLAENFTINLKGYNFTDFSNILQLTNGEKTINVTKNRSKYLSDDGIDKVYFELTVPCSSFANYIIQSNLIDIPNTTDILSLWIRKKNNIYDLHVENLSI